MINKENKNYFIEMVKQQNPEYEAVKSDFEEITKKVLILKQKVPLLQQEDITAYLAEAMGETSSSISRVLNILNLKKQ